MMPQQSSFGRVSRSVRSPLVTVVMAARNAERYLPAAIESVLAQSMRHFEFLIVNDASTDGTARILSAYQRQDSRIRLFTTDRQRGPFVSANLAIAHARGRFIARQDADDESCPDRLAVQVEALQSDPGVTLVSGPLEVFDGQTNQVTRTHHPRRWQPRLEWDLLFANAGGTSANIMFPRHFHGSPIRYPARFPYAEDYALWCTLSRLGRVVSLPRILYRYREHADSITSRSRPLQDECAARIRYDYALHYLPRTLGYETVREAFQFWNRDTATPFAGSPGDVMSTLLQLRSTFLAYVERRHGAGDRDLLRGQIDRALDERLAFWLCRSLRFLETARCRELLRIADRRGRALRVSGQALGWLAGAAVRKAGRRMMFDRRVGDVQPTPTLRTAS